jgi:hypothetical protein
MPLAKEQTPEFDFSGKLAMLPFEGFAHLAAGVRDGDSVCDLFIRHEDHFPYWVSTVSSQPIEAARESPNRDAVPTNLCGAKRSCLAAGDIGYSVGASYIPSQMKFMCAHVLST